MLRSCFKEFLFFVFISPPAKYGGKQIITKTVGYSG